MALDSPPKERRTLPLAALIVIGLICGIGAGYYLLTRGPSEDVKPPPEPQETSLPKMANLPQKEEIALPEPEYPPDAPALEQARKALREGIDPEGAVALAAALPPSPERADAAFLLLEYAAESGHAGAAFSVGRYYDPTSDTPSGTIRKNASSAYEWYQVAFDNGRAEAAAEQARLKLWVQEKAAKGFWESEQLLKTWK